MTWENMNYLFISLIVEKVTFEQLLIIKISISTG
jgi:hypothetical protein